MRGPRTLCSILVNNPGGGSGSGTVTTDGVTIQGTGAVASPIAIKQVETDASLTGAGTVASPLAIAAQTIWYPQGLSRSAFGNGNITQNTLAVGAYVIPIPVTFGHFLYDCTVADNTANVYDLGLYNSAGTLIAAVGATAGTTFCPSTSNKTLAVNPSFSPPITIFPGVYYFAFTTSAAASAFRFAAYQITAYFASASFGSSTGGACPSSITPQSYQGLDANINTPLVAILT